MPTPLPPANKSNCLGFWIVAIAALLYCGWLGSHWLPLPYSEHELSATVSRVWDIKTELAEHHTLPWWTPYYMSGSSYAINHSRGFYLIPWFIFSAFTDLETAGKLVGLLAIFMSGLAMYACTRHFLKNDWAAVLAALAYMFHPEQIIRAAGAEHMTISLFFPFIPLLWLTFARMLESGQLRDICWCALVACFAMWTDNKQAVISFLYLGCYLIYWFWPKERRKNLAATARTFGILAALGLVTGAVLIVPGLIEMKDITLFDHEQLLAWQHGFAFKSLFGLVDRAGVVTSNILAAAQAQLQMHPPTTQLEANRLQPILQRIFSMGMDAPEKYTGLVFLFVAVITILWNHRREKRRLFWFFIGMFMLSLMLANGYGSVLGGNIQTFDALSDWGGVPLAVWLAIGALVAFLVVFARRKLTTQNKWWLALGVLAVFFALPIFDLVAHFPYFKDIRAPYSFYDGPGAFWVAILLAFFVTDVLSAEKWRNYIPTIVGCVAVLFLLDFWPYQKPTRDNGVPRSTIDNLQKTYGSLKDDKDWVKTYSLSGRYFHLLGPMYSGKPQVYEAFYNWQSPVGMGLLNSFGAPRELLNLVGARYVVLDKTDPGMRQQTQLFEYYRKMFPTVAVENEDFVVLRNDTARPYVSANAQACLYVGDIRETPKFALVLSSQNYTLVNMTGERPENVSKERLSQFAAIYDHNTPPVTPPGQGQALTLQNVELTREDHQHIHIKLTAPQACIAVIAESYYPFWHADVDGKPADVLRVDCGLMGLEIGGGAHDIRLHYDPPAIYAVCGIVSVIGLLTCLGLIVISTIRPSGAARLPS